LLDKEGKAMRKTLMCGVMVAVVTTMLVGGTSVQVFAGERSVKELVRDSNLPPDIERYVLDERLPREWSVLRGPQAGDCEGFWAGTCGIIDTRAGLLAVAFLRGGPRNEFLTVYWTCTEVPGGCHDDACGYVEIGTIRTNAFGNGVFWVLLPGNPYPGKYVHWDILNSATYTSVFFDIPARGTTPTDLEKRAGDPVR
jgi:hypothetical protein